MMIWVAFNGGGGVDSVVSVLCGAGGGLAVQPVTRANVIRIATSTDPGAALKRREIVGTTFRV